MMQSRSGRINALAFAILDADGDTALLAEKMRFFSDITDADVDHAMMLAHWVKTTGGPQFIQQMVKPFGMTVDAPGAETLCRA
jgi:hypothetical protein